jgi:hypothetical protein
MVDFRAQATRHPDVVLHPFMADAYESVEHVVVLVEAYGRNEGNVTRVVTETNVMAVVPVLVTAENGGECVRDLVDWVLIDLG